MDNAEERSYIGITIGPIMNTMNLTSTPAALWASSFLFSRINLTICRVLADNFHIPEENIVVPCYQRNMNLPNDGIGRFHDHVIFASEDGHGHPIFGLEQIAELKELVYQEISKQFCISEAFLNAYVMLAAVAYRNENAIMGADKPLNSAELFYTLPLVEQTNELLALFTGDSEDGSAKNEKIKDIARFNLSIDHCQWQLLDRNGNIRSIPRIASSGKKKTVPQKPDDPNSPENPEMKKHRYYAVVRADGDHMTSIIKQSLKNDQQVRHFSDVCLNYCKIISDKVKEFRGMTVYAGGDDLLALLPCTQPDDRTIFNFIEQANGVFAKAFDEFEKEVSLSWGVLICYDKFPLYEALKQSADLLFGQAKDDGLKNCSAVKLIKNSGQTASFILPNGSLQKYLELQTTVLQTVKCDEAMMLNVLYKLNDFAALFDAAPDSQLEPLCRNIFDGSPDNYENFLYHTLPDFIKNMRTVSPIYTDTDKKCNTEETLCQVLRMLKFYTEKAGDER